ncbi:MAG: hypothetical protein JWO05_441 [Gemmatimonadetes bacterium]|nr:hypothetical protein [Gemmatimonadota bacterium]
MRRARGTRRAVIGMAILGLWMVGLGMLVRQEYFRPHVERLAEAAMRVNPSATFYGVYQAGKQIGFASSTIDTAMAAITMSDYMVADLPVGGRLHRATARTNVTLSRGLRVQQFDVLMETDAGPVQATGLVMGDTLLVLAVGVGGAAPDTQRIRISGPILLPTVVPLAVALGERPKVGKTYLLPVFDPVAMAPKETHLTVHAESLFVVEDSASMDPVSHRWKGMLADTLRAWQVTGDAGAGGFDAWVDEQGRVVQSTQLRGLLRLRRLPYEVAFENWRLDGGGSDTAAAPSSDRDILETTAIAANRRLSGASAQLRVRLGGVDLRGFALDGGRQQLHGDTLVVTREELAQVPATLRNWARAHKSFPNEVSAEPLIQSDDAAIRRLATSLTAPTDRETVQRINRWVYDSLKKKITFGVPSATQVLKSRSGDCNEHTQLFVALARSASVPTRIAAGLAYVDGRFYYHAWPEVWLGQWVAVDPTFGQFPADASHLRFTIGGLERQAELLRLINTLKIDVIDHHP